MIEMKPFRVISPGCNPACGWIEKSGVARGFLFFLVLACLPLISETAWAVGDLTVYIKPDEITVGANPAKFLVIPSNDWHESGYTMLDLAAGDHNVFCSDYPGYYTPAVTTVTIAVTDLWITNTYSKWTNYFSVDVQTDGGADLTNATWSLSSKPSSFTNYNSGTGDLSAVLCPTGSYTIVYGDVAGYGTPVQFTTNLAGGFPATFTGTYTRAKGQINIIMNPTNGIWQFVQYPTDIALFTSDALSGTGTALITNAPSGTYEIQYGAIPGFTPPANQSTNVATFPCNIYGTYGAGLSLVIHVYQPEEIINSNYYAGIGTGSYTVAGAAGTFDGAETWMFAAGSVVTLTANPSNMVIGALTNNSFFFEWGGDATNTMTPILTVNMTTNRYVTLLFSREYETYDNVGDLDYDRLPDEWERKWGLDPKSNKGDNGRTGNPDGDYIASSSTNPPVSYSFSTTNLTSSYLGANSTTPGYPLKSVALSRGYRNTSSETGVKFYNELECRGLNGCYKTNGPSGAVVDDDPRTDPTVADTNDDDMNDGWQYYFWYWRSASSYAAGLTNTSANLSWVKISPCLDREVGGTTADYDTDGDGLTDGEEHAGVGGYCTDPTHADSDGDSMDDYWEGYILSATTNLNPLFAADGMRNTDDDYYASSSNMFILTTNTVGTAFTNTVYHNAAATAVWEDVNTNSGVGLFDLYKDTIIVATTIMTNQMTGAAYAAVCFGTSSNLSAYLSGYPVWVDADGSGTYSAGDTALVNPPAKHEFLYLMAPASPGPGVTSFDPRTGWYLGSGDAVEHVNSAPFVNVQEYFGGDYLGRVAWDGGGRVIAENDDPDYPTRNSPTDPVNADTDGDQIQDGWELYVGLNPMSSADAGADPDEDELTNLEEYNNVNAAIGTSVSWATDPGVLTAPAPNDPHPRDTDWDGATDGAEVAAGCNPTTYDTDADDMPDGWELYAGTSPTTSDWADDPDGDGLINMYEFFTGLVFEWQFCDPSWALDFDTRYGMTWDPLTETWPTFMPPDFLTCPSFIYYNGIETDLAVLRADYPASGAIPVGATLANFHTTLANNQDTDLDGMDDLWEFFHGLNPLLGEDNMMLPIDARGIRWLLQTGSVDADPTTSGFQVGLPGQPFNSISDFLAAYKANSNIVEIGRQSGAEMVGPFNFGLTLMDPDADGLPNMDEYSALSYTSSVGTNAVTSYTARYHTDPTPLWQTDPNVANSICSQFYSPGYHVIIGNRAEEPSPFDITEGFDTDNDGIGDYTEINTTSASQMGTDPLDSRNPIRNRALYVDGIDDFTRTIYAWYRAPDSGTFCVEAWVKPDNPLLSANQVILEKAGSYENPHDLANEIIRANYRLGITNGLPYIMYNGQGAGTVYQATAQVAHRLQLSAWMHVAGVFDGASLTIYVNGEESSSIPTTEFPASSEGESDRSHTVMIGARDLTAGGGVPGNSVSATNYFGGYIDEVRTWRGDRSIAQIKANIYNRFSWYDITNSAAALDLYYTFDDVPDPAVESIVPSGFANLDANMSLHPTIDWWAGYSLRSTVYTGSVGQAYNYIITAEDHTRHVALSPPRDDDIHTTTNGTSTNVISGYRNTTNPYKIYRDLYFFKGAKCKKEVSWLPSLDEDDPDTTDSDGDGLPDSWEILHGLDPNDATGDQGAWGDYDNDGLNNRAEYLAGTDPNSSDTDGDGIGDYDSRSGPGARTWGELYSDGDGMPDTWETQYGLDPYKYDAHLDLDEDGWSNYSEYQAGTDPSNASSYPTPTVSGTVHYYGTNQGSMFVAGVQTNVRGFLEGGSVSVTSNSFSSAGYKEGNIYFLSYIDGDSDTKWTDYRRNDGSLSSCEPMGLAEGQPYKLSWSDMSGVEVGIEDTLPGYPRFIWGELLEPTTNVAEVLINKISEAGAPQVIDSKAAFLGSAFSEWDLQSAGISGLSAGSYQWWAGTNTGTFSVSWPTSVSKPKLVYPRGDTLIYARNQIVWAMDRNSTLYHLYVFNQAGATVYNNYQFAPYRYADGYFRAYLPAYAGDWGNGTYYWCIASYNPTGESEWSDIQSFTIDLSTDNSRWITGDVYYFGKAGATNIIVEAYDNAGFSGPADAQITYSLSCTTNSFKTSFTLRGLQAKTYYVRAFTDISPGDNSGRNGVLDWWESEGFVKASTNDYQPEPLVLTNAFYVAATQIVIRDKDTDNDDLPDAWEMHYFGNLDQTGDMDYDGDGESNLTEYSIEALDTDPTKWDTDGDGLSDHYERLYDGSESYNPYSALSNPSGGDLNPTVWDTDGDAYSDGAELRRYHTDPIDPSSYPWYLPECYDSFASPSDYDGDGRTDVGVYDEASGTWYLITWTGQFWNLAFGNATTEPLLGDYDGDGSADFAVYEPAGGYWYILTWTGQFIMLPFGDSETIPVPADYDIDGKTDFAVYYPAYGYWYIYTWQGQFTAFQFGSSAMTPVPGDYDADGKSDFAVYEPATGYWYIYTWAGNFYMLQFGNTTTTPVPGDYDGDGKSDFAVFEPATGYWYIFTWTGGFFYGQFGWSDVIPVPGDYDGDGRTDLAVYYPAAGYWFIYSWTGQFYQGQFGWSGALPILSGR